MGNTNGMFINRPQLEHIVVTISTDSLLSVIIKVISALWPSELLHCSLMKHEELLPEWMDPKSNILCYYIFPIAING